MTGDPPIRGPDLMKLCPMRIGFLTLTALLGLGEMSRGAEPLPSPTPAGEPPPVSFARDVVPFLSKHCYACHGNGKRKADLALDEFLDEAAIQKDRDLWENV